MAFSIPLLIRRSPPLVLTRPFGAGTSAGCHHRERKKMRLSESYQRRMAVAFGRMRYSCSDWRWAPQGALARGEETGASIVSICDLAGAAPGSDRRVLQRPEEPTPVTHLPNHSKPSGSDELPTRRLEDPNHSRLELYSPDRGRSAVPPFGPAAVEIVAGDPGKLPRKRCIHHR
jgi:hypothetical protein